MDCVIARRSNALYVFLALPYQNFFLKAYIDLKSSVKTVSFLMDTYLNFVELSGHEKEGKDFEIESVFRNSSVAVIAPHGGMIEPFTSEIAKMIACDRFSFYTFKSLKPHGNAKLHITSHHFDEPRALNMVKRCETVVAIHGQKHLQDAFIMVGGKDIALASQINTALGLSGFKIRPPDKGLMAFHPKNICNRGKSKKGVQIELSRNLRRRLKSDPKDCCAFVECIRSVLLKRVYSDGYYILN